jgi:hypothetical protein
MLERFFGLGKKVDDKKTKKLPEPFSIEFCKMEALIPPNNEANISYVTKEEIIFKSAADLRDGQTFELQISYHPLKAKESTITFATVMKLTKKGQLGEKLYLYQAMYTSDNDPGLKRFFAYLKEIETTQISELVDYHERRAHFRLNRVLPVVSKSFNGYKGLTKDISCGGVQVSCGGGIRKGDVVQLRLELDDYHADPIQLTGEISWVADSNQAEVRVGIRFIEVDEETQKLLREYISSIRKKIYG